MDVVKFLVECGANLTILDNSGFGCLLWAITRDNLHVARYLIEQKTNPIDINNYDNGGMDSLMHACRLGNFEAVKLLVENGISLENLNSIFPH